MCWSGHTCKSSWASSHESNIREAPGMRQTCGQSCLGRGWKRKWKELQKLLPYREIWSGMAFILGNAASVQIQLYLIISRKGAPEQYGMECTFCRIPNQKGPIEYLQSLKSREEARSEYLWAISSSVYSTAFLTHITYLILPIALRLALWCPFYMWEK